jgi:hypothetical protein
MHHDENHSRVRRRAAMLAVTAGIALLTAACGGSPSSTGSTGSGASPHAEASAQSQQLAFAGCMRSHGVTDYPDSGPIQASPGSDLDPSNPTYRAARQACQSLQPTENLTSAQAAQDNADALKFSQCMRSHGITKYPDPQAGTGGNDTINLTGIDLNSPQFLAAAQACRRYVGPNPDGKGP